MFKTISTRVASRFATRHLLVAAAVLLLAGTALAGAGSDLGRAGAQAAEQRGAVLLVFRSDYCSYCERLDQEIIQPWQRSEVFPQRLQVEHVDLDAPRLNDFDGTPRSGLEIASRYGVVVTPTVVVVDAQGRQLEESLVGLNTVDFYPAYLEAAVARALAQLAR